MRMQLSCRCRSCCEPRGNPRVRARGWPPARPWRCRSHAPRCSGESPETAGTGELSRGVVVAPITSSLLLPASAAPRLRQRRLRRPVPHRRLWCRLLARALGLGVCVGFAISLATFFAGASAFLRPAHRQQPPRRLGCGFLRLRLGFSATLRQKRSQRSFGGAFFRAGFLAGAASAVVASGAEDSVVCSGAACASVFSVSVTMSPVWERSPHQGGCVCGSPVESVRVTRCGRHNQGPAFCPRQPSGRVVWACCQTHRA